jgi:translation initiation factor 2B subunit (eIF-2B alpha/beta/delta family)
MTMTRFFSFSQGCFCICILNSSEVIERILVEAKSVRRSFRVIVADSRPKLEGTESQLF